MISSSNTVLIEKNHNHEFLYKYIRMGLNPTQELTPFAKNFKLKQPQWYFEYNLYLEFVRMKYKRIDT